MFLAKKYKNANCAKSYFEKCSPGLRHSDPYIVRSVVHAFQEFHVKLVENFVNVSVLAADGEQPVGKRLRSQFLVEC